MRIGPNGPQHPAIHMRLFTAGAFAILLAGCASTAQSGQTEDAVTDETEAPVENAEAEGTGDVPTLHATVTQRFPGSDVSHTLTYIPGGSFVVGSPENEPGREGDEGPRRTIEIEPFWMGIYEVTHNEYNLFQNKSLDSDSTFSEREPFDVDAAIRPSPAYEDPAFGMPKGDHPVVGITQWAALQFARWLYQKTGYFYRLPTETEWEYACRACAQTAYSFGDDPEQLDAYAWYLENSGEEYHPVGTKQPNEWGLYDMHGNVAEWTLDEYIPDYYATLEDGVTTPWAEPTSLHPRTVRGGAYDDDPAALRCAERLESSLAWKRRDPQLPKSLWWNTDSPFVGFRLIRPAKELSPDEIDAFFMQTLGE